MEIEVKVGRAEEQETDLLAVYLFQDGRIEDAPEAVRSLDGRLDGAIKDLLESKDFKGKEGETTVYYTRGAVPAKRIVLTGLGKREKFTLDKGRKAAAAAGRQASRLGVKRLCSVDLYEGAGDFPPSDCAQAIVEGAELSQYKFKAYKTDEETAGAVELESLTILTSGDERLQGLQQGAEAGRITSEAARMGREIVNSPGNAATPTFLALKAQEIAGENNLKCTVLDREDMEKLGMGLLLGVARGSQEPPKFIVLEHNADKEGADTIAIVGKGITFDSGGISLKPSKDMDQMKYDKSGGVTVLGVMSAAAKLNLPQRIVGIIPATENLPSGTATKPGDILRSSSGTTVEVANTDAEGRLILGDALTYALQFKPKAIIDLATLTGACIIALGHQAIGMMGNDKGLMDRLRTAGERTGERVWELPLWEEYREQNKSDVADIKNTGGRAAGTITAGAFLAKFVEDKAPWAHLDIAGTAWADKESGYLSKGGTGIGIRLLLDMLRNWG